jgi:hypothetical protein
MLDAAGQDNRRDRRPDYVASPATPLRGPRWRLPRMISPRIHDRRSLLGMRREIARGGAWLSGAGITGALGYLIATETQAGHPPRWPYYLFGALTAVGGALYAVLYFADYSGNRTERDRRATVVQVPHPQRHLPQPLPSLETSRSPLDGNRRPRGHIKSLRFRRRVGYVASVKGKVSGPTRDAEPLLLVHSIVSGRFQWPEMKLDGKGNFKARPTFGVTLGEEFILLLVFAPRSMRFINDLVDKLPEDALILDSRRVVRA